MWRWDTGDNANDDNGYPNDDDSKDIKHNMAVARRSYYTLPCQVHESMYK